MVVGVQMHITVDIEFDVLAEILGISRDECVRIWDREDLEEMLNDKMEIRVLACGGDVGASIECFDTINVGSAYC